MCGFVGFLTSNMPTLGNIEGVVTQMALSIAHRGPDDAGVWIDPIAGIAMGHRRLSVLDLSVAGRQPMQSSCERYVMVLNGEIYNHMELREKLDLVSENRFKWRGHSDTETLLAGFKAWGIETTLKKTVGMFAIAIWDRLENSLTLTRDRFGEKPLYYGWVGSGSNASFLFGSELKALRAFPGFDKSVSREALLLYMQFNYVPAPHSIYQNIFKLEPGCMLRLSGVLPKPPTEPLRPSAEYKGITLTRWWSLSETVEAGSKNQILDDVEATQALEQSLFEAVRLQSLADVPLGAFLSGGVDSSTIVALMQQQSMRAVKTFTVGFEDSGFDESPHARAVALHLGTDHNELLVTAVEAQVVIPNLASMYDEPFADSSQIPTHLVCKAARQHVTVALSGDAGDELFGGYSRYFLGPKIWRYLAHLPYPARGVIGKLINSVPIAAWDAISRPVNICLAGSSGISRAGDKAHKLGVRLSNVSNMDDLYRNLVSEWQDPAEVVKYLGSGKDLEKSITKSLLDDPLPLQGAESQQLRMMYRDSMTYLPDDILCKLDRAAMSSSLETRLPFLDHRVAEVAWQLPLQMKIRRSNSKWVLRQVLYKYVPSELIDRPKAGFGIPIGQWLRGPLRDWAESLLDENRLSREGYFYPAPIRQKWVEHLKGQRDNTASLWSVLMFQSWLAEVA